MVLFEASAPREALLRELLLCAPIADKNNKAVPILNCVRVEATTDSLRMSATDLELTLQTSCDAKVKAKGAFVVDAALLMDTVKALSDGDVAIVVDNGRVTITSGLTRFTVPLTYAEDMYPSVLETPEGDPLFAIDNDVLVEMIHATIFCVSEEKFRATLCGIILERSGATLTAFATDGHRFATANTQTEGDTAAPMLISRKAAQSLLKLAEGEKATKFRVDENHVAITCGERILFIRRTDAGLPHFKGEIRNAKHVVTINRVAFLQGVRRAIMATDGSTNAVALDLAKGKMTISAASAGRGEATDIVGIDYSGDDLRIGFVGRYLTDWLTSLDCEQIEAHFVDDRMVGRPVMDRDPINRLHLVASIRV